MLRNPCILGGSKRALTRPVEKSPSQGSQIVHGNPTTNVPEEKKKQVLGNVLGGPRCFIAGDKIRSGPQVA